MKPPREFLADLAVLHTDLAKEILVAARDADIRAEEHEAREALFALERAAHKKELREAGVDVIPGKCQTCINRAHQGLGLGPCRVCRAANIQPAPVAESRPIPSRAELIELIRDSWYGPGVAGESPAESILDALIKVGAVRT
jgi:hypothetical protein